jgi:alkanesulfonate monooxygenase SsuD/methylene tetrahydromethanopterin reductase-like flavin-dependent oxidoreductase (luciferase family)
LLRRLWRDDAISFSGEHHNVTDAGLNPLPPNKNIPIWLGGMAPQVIERAGRDPDSIGIECIIPSDTDAERVKPLQDMGVAHVALVTMNQKLAEALS